MKRKQTADRDGGWLVESKVGGLAVVTLGGAKVVILI